MINKTISVILPSYNHASYIEQSILSVMKQNVEGFDIELIVIDDFSKDNSICIINKLRMQYDFIFIRNERNLGLNATLEVANKVAKGEFYCYLASDDFFLPGKLSLQVKYLIENNFDAVYACANIYDEEMKYISTQNLTGFQSCYEKGSKELFNFVAVDDTCGPLLQSAMIRSALVKELSVIREQYRSDDWVILLYLIKNFNFGFINKPVFGYRIHSENSHKKFWVMFSYRVEVISIYLSKVDESLMSKSFSNLYLSQASALYKKQKYGMSLRFFIASLIFGVPMKKFFLFIKRKVGF